MERYEDKDRWDRDNRNDYYRHGDRDRMRNWRNENTRRDRDRDRDWDSERWGFSGESDRNRDYYNRDYYNRDRDYYNRDNEDRWAGQSQWDRQDRQEGRGHGRDNYGDRSEQWRSSEGYGRQYYQEGGQGFGGGRGQSRGQIFRGPEYSSQYYHQDSPYASQSRPSSSSSASQTDQFHHGKGPKNYRRSDERVKEDVCERLTWHSGIDATQVEVEVKDCVVTLKGTVNDRRSKRFAEELVEDVSGVKDVQNELRVSSSERTQEGSRQEGHTIEIGNKDTQSKDKSSSSM